MSSFQNDLLFGKKHELLLLDYLPMDEYTEVEMAPNRRFVEWDMKLKNGALEAKYEVKSDRLTAKTGNFCLEYNCSGQPSGISTTQADYYAYFVIKGSDHDLYLIPVPRIKELIAQGAYKKMKGGDSYRSEFYLIPKAVFAEYLTKRLVKA
jgi:hypothetical protein